MATLSVSDYSPFKLGQTRDVALVSSSRGNRDATLAMLLQTRRTVDIFSRDLDRAIYDDHEIVQSIRALVVGSRRARVRVLVRTSSLAVTQGHRLVHVAQRLSTFVQIRKVANEHRTYNSGLFIADSMGTLIRRFADRYEGEACFTNPIQARDYGRLFNDMWAISCRGPQPTFAAYLGLSVAMHGVRFPMIPNRTHEVGHALEARALYRTTGALREWQ